MKNLEKGSVTPIIALLMVAAFGALYVLGIVTKEIGLDSKAQTAADAAALAGASNGQVAAQTAALANDGSLIRFSSVSEGDVSVIVSVHDHRATARAQREVLTENKSGY